LHEAARDARDLEQRLLTFYGVGPITMNIFLRELRPFWIKADPNPLPVVVKSAKRLSVDLARYDRKNLTFARVEAGLIRRGVNSRNVDRSRVWASVSALLTLQRGNVIDGRRYSGTQPSRAQSVLLFPTPAFLSIHGPRLRVDHQSLRRCVQPETRRRWPRIMRLGRQAFG